MRCQQTATNRRPDSTRLPESVNRSKVLAGWYDEFASLLVSYLARFTRSIHEAEDIAHEAFLHMLLTQLCGPIPNPKALLFTTALNLLKDRCRNAHTRVTSEAAQIDEVEIPDWCEPSQMIEGEQALAQVAETLGQLRPATRKAFLLNRIEMHSNSETATRMGITVSMVEKHIRYAMDALETAGFEQPRHAAGKRAKVVRGRVRRTKRPTAAGYSDRRAPVTGAQTAGMWRWDKSTVARYLATRSALSKGSRGYGARNVGLSSL